MADLGGIPVDFVSDKGESRADKECFEVGGDEICKKDEAEKELIGKVGSLGGLGQEEGEIGVVERGVEMGSDEDCEKINVERILSDNGFCNKLGDIGCLIEENLGKVSSDGASNTFVLVGALENYKNVGGDLSGANDGEVNDSDGSKSDEMIKLNGSNVTSGGVDGTDIGDVVGLNGNGMNSLENASYEDENVGGDLSAVNDDQVNGGDGLKSAGVDDTDIGDAVVFYGNGVKSRENVSDEDESDSDSEFESESSSSISSSSSSSSDEDDDHEEEGKDSQAVGDEKKSKVEEGEVMLSNADEMVAWSDNEDAEDGGGSGMAGPILSKNELKVLPPVPSVTETLQPHHDALPVGIILSIIGTQVIVEGIEKHNPLNEGSILWITNSRLPLGIVDEIFGPVKNPYYIVRYNSESEVPTGIQQGTSVSFVQEFANHVLNDKNLYQKGYDASGDNDEELSDEFEFSDDEKEAEHRRMLKMKKRGTNESKPGTKRMEKRQFKKTGNWDCNRVLAANNTTSGGDKLAVTEDQHLVPSITTSLNLENHACSSGLGQGLAGNNAMVSAFPLRGQAPGFCAPNGIWSNGFRHQQHQSIGLPNELAANVIPWMQQNHPHQLYQTPSPTSMAFQQQISTIPRLPGNFISLGGHPNLGGAPPFGPWSAVPDQNIFNQSQFGMGLQTPNAGEQSVQFHGSFNLQPLPVSYGRPQNFNRGSGGGREVHHRGGGRSGGGRGRFQRR